MLSNVLIMFVNIWGNLNLLKICLLFLNLYFLATMSKLQIRFKVVDNVTDYKISSAPLTFPHKIRSEQK